jgi:hypothetical protein
MFVRGILSFPGCYGCPSRLLVVNRFSSFKFKYCSGNFTFSVGVLDKLT